MGFVSSLADGDSKTLKLGVCALAGTLGVCYAAKRAYDALCYYPFPGPRGGILGIKVTTMNPQAIEKLFLDHTDAEFSPVSLRVRGLLLVLLGNEQDIRKDYFKNRPVTVQRINVFKVECFLSCYRFSMQCPVLMHVVPLPGRFQR